jgi:hypothetical protein
MRFDSLLLGMVVLCAALPLRAENWPCWRGPRGDGTSHEHAVPLHWSEAENIAWKVAVPGRGHASPIVWADRIFLVSADEDRQERLLCCFDRSGGSLLWQRTVLVAPLEEKHALNSYASSTPATDGDQVYVAFLDRQEMLVAAYDLQGERRWAARPGGFASKHGFCSCPVLFENLVIVNGDHDGNGYLVALDRETGQTVWRIDRPNNTRSYVTPLLRRYAGRDQLVLSGSKCVTSYDPRTGKLHWIIDGPTEQFVASLVDWQGLLFMTCGYPDKHMLAIRPDGQGNVTNTHIAWRETRGAAYVPSPVAAEGYFLVVADNGIASCFEATTGKRQWMERIGTRFSSSPIAAEGRVYFTSDDGQTKIIRPRPTLEIVASNRLGENVFASMAVSQGKIYVRGEKHLYAIGR